MTEPRLESIRKKIEALKPKQKCIYHTGITGSLYGGVGIKEARQMLEWFTTAQDSGEWDFVQRKIMSSGQGLSVFEYTAVKRINPYTREV